MSGTGGGSGTDWTSMAASMAGQYLLNAQKNQGVQQAAAAGAPMGTGSQSQPMSGGGGKPIFQPGSAESAQTGALEGLLPKMPINPDIERMIAEFIQKKMAGQYGPGGTGGFGGPLQAQ